MGCQRGLVGTPDAAVSSAAFLSFRNQTLRLPVVNLRVSISSQREGQAAFTSILLVEVISSRYCLITMFHNSCYFLKSRHILRKSHT